MTYYGVTHLVVERDVTVGVGSAKYPIKMKWATGMIGVMPVFETKEQALKYCDGDESIIIELEDVKP